MLRTPLHLAALASAAVPGVDARSVQPLPTGAHGEYDLAVVADGEHRRFVVRAPRTAAAGARLESSLPLLPLLARRLPYAVPTVRGMAAMAEGGRAAIYGYIAGRPLDVDTLTPGPGPAADLGRAIAALHNLAAEVIDDAGLPSYDAGACRQRRLVDLDRAAATGRVPTALLARWEAAIEDVALWTFAATPVHGGIRGNHVILVTDADTDPGSTRVRGIVGWEDARVGDPADDLADAALGCPTDVLDTISEAYAHTRIDRPDPNLVVRARLAGELDLAARLTAADTAGDEAETELWAQALVALADDLAASSHRWTELEPVAPRRSATGGPTTAG